MVVEMIKPSWRVFNSALKLFFGHPSPQGFLLHLKPEPEELALASIGHCLGEGRPDIIAFVGEFPVDDGPGVGGSVGSDVFRRNLVLGKALARVVYEGVSDLGLVTTDKKDSGIRPGNRICNVVEKFRDRGTAVI
jgi:hypothetical protein